MAGERTIQANNVMLVIMKDDWTPYLCASDMTISFSADVLPVATVSDGIWGKNAYQKLNWSISLSGLLLMNAPDDANWTGFDSLINWLGMNHVKFRMSFPDAGLNYKSVQGEGMFQGLSFSAASGNLVKNDCSVLGSGALMFYDGLIPCPSNVTSINVTGQTAADGIIHITYTVSGAPYAVQYRISNGPWIRTAVGAAIDIPGLANGSYSVDVQPICLNGYLSDNITSQTFVVTRAATCSAVITDIVFGTGNISATPTYTGTPSNYKFRIDGGAWTTVAIAYVVGLAGQSVGSHTIEMVPICSNSVEGTGRTESFTIASQPAQSIVNYHFISWQPGNSFYIYVDGVLVVNESVSGATGSITVSTGAVIKGILDARNTVGSACTLQTTDSTISSVLDNRSGTAAVTLQYSFTTNGDTYLIFAQVTP